MVKRVEPSVVAWEHSVMKIKLVLAVTAVVALLSGCASSPEVLPEYQLTSPQVRDDIIKSPNDSRDYRHLVLPNGLKVLLVSDPKADKSAASLSVYRGSFDDPEDRAGLAHFLEHMLFIGTEKYPDPDGYFSFVEANGGSSNAYTASEVTNYFFDVQPEAFREGLDRFAQFFISPLLDRDYVEREKNAVQSEYQLQLKEDGWRGYSVQKKAMNAAHPLSKFNIGSLDTLSGDVHGALLKFFQENYSANQMGLVVLDREPLDAMQGWIVDLFSQISNRGIADVERQMPVFQAGQLPATLRHDNLKDYRELSFTFPIPPILELYRKKPAAYLANLLGHEGEGSLHKLLSELGWINSLAAGPDSIDDNHAIMSVSMELTEKGAAQIPEITGYLFAYLDLLRQGRIEQWIYDEQAIVAELDFRFAEKASAIGTVQSLSPRLQDYPTSELLVAPYLMEEFDPSLINEFLASLVPGNVLVTIAGPGYVGQQSEEWFGVSYDLVTGPIAIASVEASMLALPGPNPFLPESLSLLAADDAIPRPVIKQPEAEIYVDTDLEFGVPRAVTHVSLRNPGGLMSAADSVRGWLYAMLVEDDLNSLAYPALLAGVNYQVASPPKGIRVSIGGYEDKQFVLLEEVMQRLVGLPISPERFVILKDRLLRELENQAKNKPFQQVYGRLMDELVSSAWPAPELMAELAPLSREDLRLWRDELFSGVSMQALIHGNVAEGKAELLQALIKRYVPLAAVTVLTPEVRDVVGVNEVRMEIDHDDAAMLLFIQDDAATLEARSRSALFSHLIGPAYFSSLRTDQQLGYVVSAMNPVFYERGGVGFLIQSPVAGPRELRERTRRFLDVQVERFARMSDEVFSANRAGLITQLIQRDKNLGQRAQRYWSELDRGITTFDARRQKARMVAQLTKADMISYLDRVRSLFDTDYLFIYSEGRIAEVD